MTDPTAAEAMKESETPPASAAWYFSFDLEWHHNDPEEIPPTLVGWSLSFGLLTPPFRSKLKIHATKVGGVFGVRQKFWLGEN